MKIVKEIKNLFKRPKTINELYEEAAKKWQDELNKLNDVTSIIIGSERFLVDGNITESIMLTVNSSSKPDSVMIVETNDNKIHVKKISEFKQAIYYPKKKSLLNQLETKLTQ